MIEGMNEERVTVPAMERGRKGGRGDSAQSVRALAHACELAAMRRAHNHSAIPHSRITGPGANLRLRALAPPPPPQLLLPLPIWCSIAHSRLRLIPPTLRLIPFLAPDRALRQFPEPQPVLDGERGCEELGFGR